MSKRFRPGQLPASPRIYDIDIETILDDVRNLFSYAREGKGVVFDGHRASVAVDVAITAARAREKLARNEPVASYELGALVGLHRSRIYQMIRSGRLELGPGGITPATARRLLDTPHLMAPPTAHRLWIEPSYTRTDWRRWGTMELVADRVFRQLALPKGTTYRFSSIAVELRVPATAQLSAEAAEVLRQSVLAHLEATDPEGFFRRDDREVARA